MRSLTALIAATVPLTLWSAAPETDEVWQPLKNAVLTVAVEESCPVSTAQTYAIAAKVLSGHDIDLGSTDRRITLELNCYQPAQASKPHYALIAQFRSEQGSNPSSYRRIGALPGREQSRQLFLSAQLERTLGDMLGHHLAQQKPAVDATP